MVYLPPPPIKKRLETLHWLFLLLWVNGFIRLSLSLSVSLPLFIFSPTVYYSFPLCFTFPKTATVLHIRFLLFLFSNPRLDSAQNVMQRKKSNIRHFLLFISRWNLLRPLKIDWLLHNVRSAHDRFSLIYCEVPAHLTLSPRPSAFLFFFLFPPSPLFFCFTFYGGCNLRGHTGDYIFFPLSETLDSSLSFFPYKRNCVAVKERGKLSRVWTRHRSSTMKTATVSTVEYMLKQVLVPVTTII